MSLDEEILNESINNLYNSISCNFNKTHDWNLFRSLFIKSAVLIEIANEKYRILSVDEFINEMRNAFIQHSDLMENGFSEKCLENIYSIQTNCAICESRYLKEYNINRTDYKYNGINYIQFIKDNEDWKILSIMWEE